MSLISHVSSALYDCDYDHDDLGIQYRVVVVYRYFHVENFH